MSIPDSGPIRTEQIQAVTAELDRRLRRMHLSRRDRRTVVDEVRADLETAAAEGVNPEALVGPDIDAFAREAIEAGGYRPWPRDYPRVLVGGLLAASVAVVAAYWLIVGVVQPAFASWFTLEGRYPTAGPVVVFGAIALTGLLGALAGLKWLLAGRPAARPTLRRAALLLPIGAVAGIAAVVAVAHDPDYRSTLGTVTLQVLFVVLGVVLALGVARWWAVRATTDRDGAASISHAAWN
ncbi:hypothetical protein ACNTMW_07955 [Planosporangium sp. 12N6]|uniref:hypothetical protein n=1 Tax=Planosporangium spinosum TaxID=3402278 RepID=UPI003CF5FF8D